MDGLRKRASLFFRLKARGLSMSDECKAKCGKCTCVECGREIHLSIDSKKFVMDQIDPVDCDTCLIRICVRSNPTSFRYLEPMSVTKLLALLESANFDTEPFVNELGTKLLSCIENAVYFNDEDDITAYNCLVVTDFIAMCNRYSDMVRAHSCCKEMDLKLNSFFEKMAYYFWANKNVLQKSLYNSLPKKHECMSPLDQLFEEMSRILGSSSSPPSADLDPIDILRSKIGDQSVSVRRAYLAIQRPVGFELIATLFSSGVEKLVGPLFGNALTNGISLLDANKDVLWLYVKLEGSEIAIQVPDMNASVACMQCKKPLVIGEKNDQVHGVARWHNRGEAIVHTISLYWRCCSQSCSSIFKRQFVN